MKILFVTDYLHPCSNGIAVYSENTIRCLKQAGCSVTTFGPKGSPSADAVLPTLNIARFMPQVEIVFCFPNWKLLKAVLFEQYDVIHINCPQALSGTLICILAKFKKRKVVYFNHGNIAVYCKLNYRSLWYRKFATKASMLLYYSPQWLFNPTIVQNPGCSDLLSQFRKPFRVKEGACGANLQLFTFSPSYEKYHLVSVGRLSLEKNWLHLLALFAYLPSHYRFTIIGSGSLEEELKKKCVQLGLDNVFFTGKIAQKEVSSYLQKAQAYISASFETWGLTLTEALACGTPLVYPNHPPFDRLYGSEFPEGGYQLEDAPSFVLSVLQTERSTAESRRKCHDFAQQFSWERATEKLLEAYRA